MDNRAVEEIKHHFGVVAEGLETRIDLIAEGHLSLRDEIKGELSAFRAEVKESFGELRSRRKSTSPGDGATFVG